MDKPTVTTNETENKNPDINEIFEGVKEIFESPLKTCDYVLKMVSHVPVNVSYPGFMLATKILEVHYEEHLRQQIGKARAEKKDEQA